jgi:hypothetical protein
MAHRRKEPSYPSALECERVYAGGVKASSELAIAV